MIRQQRFHAAEIAIQQRDGLSEADAERRAAFIRPAMPEQHRQFFESLPFVILGLADQQGYPWALPHFAQHLGQYVGQAPFIESPSATTLQLASALPLVQQLALDTRTNAKVGLLGIELATRRRNRMNGRIQVAGPKGLSITVEQSFGNCPQYIQTRTLHWVKAMPAPHDAIPMAVNGSLGAELVEHVEAADSFYIASRSAQLDDSSHELPQNGIDASHRGGKPGFVKVEGNTLSFPDFSGNRFFNTLGNIEADGRVGLLFPDFVSGDMLLLSGRAHINWDKQAIAEFAGAERIVEVSIERQLLLRDYLPLRGKLEEISPALQGTGSWQPAAKQAFTPFTLIDKQIESRHISSFYLAPQDKLSRLEPFKPGQSIALKLKVAGHTRPLVRNYSLSQAANGECYRISVKREDSGAVSRALHDQLSLGDSVQLARPSGQFYLTDSNRPAVLISGGVGVTPMMAMLEQRALDAAAGLSVAQLWFIHASRDSGELPFAKRLRELSQQHAWLNLHIALSRPLPQDRPEIDFDSQGRLSADTLKPLLPNGDFDYYLCGSLAFMRSLYQGLLKRGIDRQRIHYELFAEGSLEEQAPVQTAEHAEVEFAKSGLVASWHPTHGSLLDFAEQQGLSPEHSCRNGNCGACACKLTAGKVVYPSRPGFTPADDEVLICSARPALGSTKIVIDC
ncbi:pyridoxamine 5'-phosphate oxidase family protein [Aliagarivorans marinus]|uniref:2Fe-2S iron-sulfur cluster-binding protein n=1 Tax=Aliagarivorans marinus TaxID=561965 RepID=UPI0003FB2404|nr:pyridoxamine 5'-phosphate oxidase family protein [Aliagarivorans marinus]